jgi:hypothetical protein
MTRKVPMTRTMAFLIVSVFGVTATTSVLIAASDIRDVDNICAEKYPGFAGFITEADIGKTFSYVDTGRFGICLDAKMFPLKNLDTSDCDRKSIFGYVSNWSLQGPDNYPIGFEITGVGSCVVRNGTFHVRIVGTKLE